MIKLIQRPQLPLRRTEVHDTRHMRNLQRASARTLGPLTDGLVAQLAHGAPGFVIVSDELTVALSVKERADAPRAYRSSAVEDRWLHIAYRHGSRGKARSVLLIWDEHVVMWHSQALFGLTLALGDLDRWVDPDQETIIQLVEAALPIQMGRAAGMDEDLAAAYGQLARVHKLTLSPREFRKALEQLGVEQRQVAYLLAPGWTGTPARLRSLSQKLTPAEVNEIESLGPAMTSYAALRAERITHTEALEAASVGQSREYILARQSSLNHTEALARIATGRVEAYCTALKTGASRAEAQEVADRLTDRSAALYPRARHWVGHPDALSLTAAEFAEMYCTARTAGPSSAQAQEAVDTLGRLPQKTQQAYLNRLRALNHAEAMRRSVPGGLMGSLPPEVCEIVRGLIPTWTGTWADLITTAHNLATAS